MGVVAFIVGLAIALTATAGAGFEGRSLHAYQYAGQWIICEGHTRGVKQGDHATPAQCDAYKAADLKRAASSVNSCLSVPVPLGELASFVDYEFNTGGFCGSRLAALASAGKHKEACESFMHRMRIDGKDCRLKTNNCGGIVKRRNAEKAMCLHGFNA